MFEEVAGEDGIERTCGDGPWRSRVDREQRHVRAKVDLRVRVEVDGELLVGIDVVDEVAVSCGEVEQPLRMAKSLAEQVVDEHAPHALPVGQHLVEPGPVHLRQRLRRGHPTVVRELFNGVWGSTISHVGCSPQ